MKRSATVFVLLPMLAALPASSEEAVQPTPMASIPAGSYQRLPGRNKKDQFTITLHAFRIDRDEVTIDQYMACVKAKKCAPPKLPRKVLASEADGDLAVTQIKWKDADAYCHFVGKRLPTVAEWERAAFPPGPEQKGEPPYRKDPCIELNVSGYHGHREFCRFPNDKRRVETVTLDHGQQRTDLNEDEIVDVVHTSTGPDDQPIYDMYGNVKEWTNDWHGLPGDPGYYFEPKITVNPPGAASSLRKSACGGGFASTDGSRAGECRGEHPNDPQKDIGFRCAADAAPPPSVPPPPSTPPKK